MTARTDDPQAALATGEATVNRLLDAKLGG